MVFSSCKHLILPSSDNSSRNQASAILGVEPDHIGTLYSYLVAKPEYSTSESRQSLVRRLRETLVKNISIQGVCKPIEGVIAIAKVEQPEDRDFSFSRYVLIIWNHVLPMLMRRREDWEAGAENRKRGEEWLNQIYKGNLSASTDHFVAHRDFDFISREITYGFYLSDHSILGPVETELIVLSGIMIQNLPLETAWHLRGIRRVGVSMEDVETIQQCVCISSQIYVC